MSSGQVKIDLFVQMEDLKVMRRGARGKDASKADTLGSAHVLIRDKPASFLASEPIPEAKSSRLGGSCRA